VERRLFLVTRIRVIDRGVVVAQDPPTEIVKFVGRDTLDAEIVVSQVVAPS
jgi:hypothetical protein